jgi:hypothetical protein
MSLPLGLEAGGAAPGMTQRHVCPSAVPPNDQWTGREVVVVALSSSSEAAVLWS